MEAGTLTCTISHFVCLCYVASYCQYIDCTNSNIKKSKAVIKMCTHTYTVPGMKVVLLHSILHLSTTWPVHIQCIDVRSM